LPYACAPQWHVRYTGTTSVFTLTVSISEVLVQEYTAIRRTSKNRGPRKHAGQFRVWRQSHHRALAGFSVFAFVIIGLRSGAGALGIPISGGGFTNGHFGVHRKSFIIVRN
jgi:hypothetical protein